MTRTLCFAAMCL